VALRFDQVEIGQRELSQKVAFGSHNQILESVTYDGGNPVEYSRYSYDALYRLMSVTSKTVDAETIYSFAYKTGNQPFEVTVRNASGVLSRTQYQTESKDSLTIWWTRVFDKTGQLQSVVKETRDKNGRLTEAMTFDSEGKVCRVEAVTRTASTTTTKTYTGDSQLTSTRVEKFDARGNILELSFQWQGDLQFMGSILSRSDYKYDKSGNWLENTQYTVSEKYGREYQEPVRVVYRDIVYRAAPTSLPPKIEPAQLFARSKPDEAVMTPPSSASPKMMVSESSDPLDDLKTVTFILTADKGKGSYGDSVTFVVRAKETQEPEAFINWNSYLGEEAFVTSRVGDDPAEDCLWSISTDHKASFYPGEIYSFINRLTTTNKLVARVTPYGESPITAEFDMSEFATLAKPYESLLRKPNEAD
jgi:type VI secretion system protein VasI